MAFNFEKRSSIAFFGVAIAAVIAAIALRTYEGKLAFESQASVANSNSRMAFNDTKPSASTKVASAPLAEAIDRPGETASKSLSTLNEILAAHGDNDPRLDTELLHLDAGAKKLFRERYAKIPREEQNDRGTIVFLLGRNIIDGDDVQFIANVLKENPCLSLENCDTPPARLNSHEAPSEMALAYSQAVSVVSFEKFLEANPNSEMKHSILESLREASKSSSSAVSRIAGKAAAKYNQLQDVVR